MRHFVATVALVAALLVAACQQGPKGTTPGDNPAAQAATPALGKASEPLMQTARDQFKPIPASYKDIPGNSAMPDQISLGTMLYHDPRLSKAHSLSCASCHNIGLGGGDGEATSIGHKWQFGGRNAPTVLNSAFNTAQFWDGRAKDLVEQAGGPLVNPIEMAATKEHVIEQLKSISGYLPAFKAAFPGEADPITLDNVQKAIAAFETTLITPNAPFDKYLLGDAKAMTAAQKDGLKLYNDTGSSSCHNGVNLGGQMYAKFGVVAAPGDQYRPAADKGRSVVTKAVTDEYSFKVPTLRNITLTGPYFHTGSVWDLKEAVKVMGKAQLGQELSDSEADQIIAFLGALKGEQPKVAIPILPEGGASTKRPER